MRWIVLVVALLITALLYVTLAQLAAADDCLTREEAITLISHKSDVEHHNPPWVKARIWAIADRESGLTMCDRAGRVKISPTGDFGLLQYNGGGVWRNCLVNPHCHEPALIGDPGAQVDVMLAYFDRYGDFCPWNPAANYAPGCGYR